MDNCLINKNLYSKACQKPEYDNHGYAANAYAIFSLSCPRQSHTSGHTGLITKSSPARIYPILKNQNLSEQKCTGDDEQ